MRKIKLSENCKEAIFEDGGAFLVKAWEGTLRMSSIKGYIDLLDEEGTEIATFYYGANCLHLKEA